MDNLAFIFIAGAMFFATFLSLLFRTRPEIAVMGTGLAFIGVCLYSVPKMRRALKEAQTLKLGRDGERHVAEILDDLKADKVKVLHDLVAGDFNVDHVLIAPQGVFAVETKTYSKREGNPKISYDAKHYSSTAWNL